MVKIERLTKSFGSHTLFKDLTLQFPQGELTVIMGPSGCGKSTLLRCINFLELFDSGRISIGDISVEWNAGEASGLPAQKRHTLQKMRSKTGMVFQSFNLFPHLTVLENVTLAPIQVKKMNPNEAAEMGGRILERGSHDSLYALGGRYWDLYTRQHGVETNLFLAPGEGDKVEQNGEGADAKEAAGLTEAVRLLRGR